jgi:hypothetical protein
MFSPERPMVRNSVISNWAFVLVVWLTLSHPDGPTVRDGNGKYTVADNKNDGAPKQPANVDV